MSSGQPKARVPDDVAATVEEVLFRHVGMYLDELWSVRPLCAPEPALPEGACYERPFGRVHVQPRCPEGKAMNATADDLPAWLTTAMDAAQRDAEAAREGAEGRWRRDGFPYREAGRIEDDLGSVVVYNEGSPTEEQATHIARHNPAAVLRRIAADRKLIADLLDERHVVADDPWFSCAAATERDGGCSEAGRWGKPCDCGRDERVERRLRIIAEGYGRGEPNVDPPA